VMLTMLVIKLKEEALMEVVISLGET